MEEMVWRRGDDGSGVVMMAFCGGGSGGAGITMKDAKGVVYNKNFPCLGSNKSDSMSPNRQVTMSPTVKVHEYVSEFNTSAAIDEPSDSFKAIN
ncbi:hypothetical protein Tco_1175667 [Tanacetum coccineum]